MDRNEFHHFSAIGAKDQFQKEVYEYAEKLAKENNFKNIIDVGCGSGYKLLKNFASNYQFIGIDIRETYQHLLKTYPEYNWMDGEKTDFSKLKADVVICADVIEHVENPNELLTKIKSISDVKMIVLSSPDRLLVRGWYDYGPPKNITHIREWNGKEFAKYIKSQGLEIITHQVTNYGNSTQMLVCKPVDTKRKKEINKELGNVKSSI